MVASTAPEAVFDAESFINEYYGAWSDPNRVVLTTTDSNTWGGASGYVYTFPRQPNGTPDIDVVIVREGKNLKGKMLGFVLGTSDQRC